MKRFWGQRGWGFLAAVMIMAPTVAQAAITNFAASNDATNVSYSFSFSGAPSFLRVYLDTDQKSTTGLSIQGMGADFLIENGNLFRYSGTGGAWGFTRLGASGMTKPSSTSVRWVVARSALGSPAVIRALGNADNADYTAILTQNLTTTTPPTTTTVPPTTVTWTRCATEGGTCSFSGTRQIRYGANGIFAYKTATGSIACNNATFGDPVVGVVKDCDYSSALTTTTTTVPQGPVTTTTVPQPPVTTTTVPSTPPPSGSSSQVSYTSSAAQFANPERGLYHQLNCNAALSQSTLQSYRTNEGITLILCYFNMSQHLTSTLSSTTLANFNNNMNLLRNAGIKAVIRFVYNQNDSGAEPTLSLINTHMDQLAPGLSAHKDVIATIQVGFIGSWGEWANSQHFGQIQALSSQNMADRKALTDKLLSVVPVDRTVQIRFPRQKMSFYGSSPLTSAEAFTGTARARIGHHNDCFLTTSSDWGTYGNTSVEYPYLAEETKYTPMGGETCAYMAPRSDCPTAEKEVAMFHWSYLHLDYNVTVLNAWRTQGCFDRIKSKLGYRFELKSATLPSSVRVGGSAALTLNIQNVGYASPYNARGLELVLRNNSTGAVHKVRLNSDPRRWLPGSVIQVSQTVVFPTSIPAGTYSMLLNLPDGSASLANNPAYSIQLANTNVWEAATGYNRLNANVVISP